MLYHIQVLEKDLAVNAMDACARFGVDAATLEAAWRRCEPANKVVKFGGGFYCGLIDTIEGKEPLYVFNAFFMAMRSQFVGESNSIYYFSVEWSPNQVSWADFRGKMVGPTDPGQAPPDSIRGTIAAKWEEFGLEGPCSKGKNGVHASASPLEGLAEKTNWLSNPIAADPFGKLLLDGGVSEAVIKEWCLDARVRLPEVRLYVTIEKKLT